MVDQKMDGWKINFLLGRPIIVRDELLVSGRVSIKGQLGVPLTVYPLYLLCSLGILGDNLPINTHYIGLI